MNDRDPLDDIKRYGLHAKRGWISCELDRCPCCHGRPVCFKRHGVRPRLFLVFVEEVIRRVRSFSSVLIPMIVDSIRMSENLALALINRGFGASRRMTFFDEIRMKACDYRALAMDVIFLGAVFIMYFRQAGRL